MKITLNSIKNSLSKYRPFLIFTLVIVLLLAIIATQQILQRRRLGEITSPPASQQPVLQGKLDTSAPIVQQSRSSLAKLKPKLPYRTTVTTTSGSTITITAYTKTPDEYDLYVGILGIDFTTPKNDPDFEKTVQDFNETATNIFGFLEKNNVNPSGIYIVWAESFQDQKTAESWLETYTENRDKTK